MSALLDRSPLSPIPDTPIGLPGQPWQPFHKSIMKICRHPYVKSMLATVPMGITAGILGGPVQVVFILNLAALIPLVGLVTIAIADLSLMTGRVLEELLKASVGNAIELAIGIVAMKRGHVHMAQSTLVGSMLCYTLLVPGSCFYLAGLSKEHLHFDHTLINIMSSLLMALKSHASIFHLAEASSECSLGRQKPNDHDGTEHQPTKIFAPQPAIVTLVAGMSCLIACVSFIVDSVNGFAQELGLSTAFLTLVLVPLVGNSTRYAAIVTVALKGHVESAVRANLNSTLRITLLVTPTLVILAWVSGLSMTLQLDTFEATMLFLAVVVMSHVIQDGKSNYFEGLMLIGTYIISVAAFYMRPGITK
ncbi:hypothetical protein ETB97_001936 [Aspergillus alliaceus]|uniref:Sodium/calcium exchanger membrane region domain-containing protein n=1 Tax=Petromyces alliaceus TaxID=209559 RepID=A0A8H6ADP6_PETAA|nr:hypothetical protein ETB97_001936 [Aspergillus burnettii]